MCNDAMESGRSARQGTAKMMYLFASEGTAEKAGASEMHGSSLNMEGYHFRMKEEKGKYCL